jgi:glycosyltransferase involved in cell wall biosynthesis
MTSARATQYQGRGSGGAWEQARCSGPPGPGPRLAGMAEALRETLGAARHRWGRPRYRRVLARVPVAVPRDGIRVSYGDVLPPGESGAIRGGRVKLLYLQAEFPESPGAFNILYLVSSAQPRYVDELARWARGRGVKVVWNQDGVAYPAWAGRRAGALNATMRAAMRHAHYVLYQSEFCRASAARFLGVPAAPSEVLPNCVDIDRFRPAETPPPSEPWVLLAAGSHQQPARVVRAIEVVAELRQRGRDARLLIAGLLDWRDAAADVARSVGILGVAGAVDVLPPYTQREAPELFRRAHVLLHFKYKDPCPTVVIEAMACGVPVVGSRSGGLPELVGDEAGVLLEVPESWDELHVPYAAAAADAVERILGDDAQWARWRAVARRRAESRYACEPWMARHRAIFRCLIGQA